jgi:hypothetical protein
MFIPPPTPAIPVAAVIDTIGVNTHIDSRKFGYQNLTSVEAAIRYLGVKNIRDSAAQAGDVLTWAEVARATGVKFDDFIGETGPQDMHVQLTFVPALAHAGLLNYLEGGNEEDDPYARNLGNNLHITAQFQHQVYAVGKSLGVPVINMSFGQGWTPQNQWHGDYDKVGDLSAHADFANAHTYPTGNQTTEAAIKLLNDDAHIAAPGRPVITTEIGWDRDGTEAADVLQAVLDGIKAGDVKTYFYALFNDGSGRFGLMNEDATPKPAGRALHDFTTLLSDGGNARAASLRFALDGQQDSDRTLLMHKSDGSFWLALWNESAGLHTVTLHLSGAAAQIQVFDPVTGTTPVATATGTDSMPVRLDHNPLLIRIVPPPR